MDWFKNQDRGSSAKTKKIEVVSPELEICIDGEHWIPINKHSVDKVYSDAMLRLLIVVDEIAELTTKSGIKTTEGKNEDALKDEIISLLNEFDEHKTKESVFAFYCLRFRG